MGVSCFIKRLSWIRRSKWFSVLLMISKSSKDALWPNWKMCPLWMKSYISTYDNLVSFGFTISVILTTTYIFINRLEHMNLKEQSLNLDNEESLLGDLKKTWHLTRSIKQNVTMDCQNNNCKYLNFCLNFGLYNQMIIIKVKSLW